MKALQIGLGGFGKFHLQAWIQMGMRESLWVAELDPKRQAMALEHGIPRDRVGPDCKRWLNEVEVVDIVTPTDSHAPLILAALKRGKDLFVEKPMTLTSQEAKEVAQAVSAAGRILQVGFYYRVHPLAQEMRRLLEFGELGQPRYLSGKFLGFKRARTDVGVTHTDAIHFIDLCNWLMDSTPEEVAAVTRDHFGRGMEDLSVVWLTYPNGVLANIESGYLQPGRWADPVVPKARTTKELTLCGSQGTVEGDFEAGTLDLHRVHHESVEGVWQMVHQGTHRPAIARVNPVDQVVRELQAFLESVKTRRPPEADVVRCGVELAQLMEAIYESARVGRPVKLNQRALARGLTR